MPYSTYIDERYMTYNIRGSVSYEVHTASTSMSLLSKVNSLIDEYTETQFSGEWMLVAEWKDVTQYSTSYVSHLFLIPLFVIIIIV